MQQAARREACRAGGASADRRSTRLVGPERRRVPLGRLDSRRSRRRSARRPWSGARPARVRSASTCVAERIERGPGLVGERHGDARLLVDARDAISKENSTSAGSTPPVIGAAGAVVRRRGERDVAFAGQQAGGRIEPDPAGAGQIDLGPGVQVGEVLRRCRPGRRAPSRRASAGSDSRRRSAPARPRWRSTCTSSQADVAARAGRQRQRFLRRLHARLHADQIADRRAAAAG